MSASAHTQVSPAVTKIAALLAELNEVVERHEATGFVLMFAPQHLDLPPGYVLVQQIDKETGVITLVPTQIDTCSLEDALQETQGFDLSDREYIEVARAPGRRHGCTVHHSAHTYKPS
jgi:hypothetical protein